jgi:hypothetical protein
LHSYFIITSSGGNAQPFDNQTEAQEQMLANHTHIVYSVLEANGGNQDDKWSNRHGFKNTRTSNAESSVALVGDENRPTNYTIKIFRRIA